MPERHFAARLRRRRAEGVAAALVGVLSTRLAVAEPGKVPSILLQPLPAPQPILGVEDDRSEGPIARYYFEPWGEYSFVRDASSNAHLGAVQLALGPDRGDGAVLPSFSFRTRNVFVFDATDRGPEAGPMTFALQRAFLVDSLNIMPLINLHFGIDIAFSTPWLSGRTVVPPAVLSAHAVDTWLAANGWSLRPLGGYVRADLLACRNTYLELAGIPEVFVPTGVDAPAEYDLGFQADFGLGLACGGKADAFSHHLALLVEYRGRAWLEGSRFAGDYRQSLSLAAQLDAGPTVFEAFGTSYNADFGSAWALGLRFQIGLWGLPQ
jgi:hypothetical protein